MISQQKVGRLALVLTSFIIFGCAGGHDQPSSSSSYSGSATTQELSANDMEIIREKVRADKKLLVSQNMELTMSEEQTFWPIYDSYQQGLDRLLDGDIEIIQTFARNYESMSDSVAKELLDDFLDLDDRLLTLKQAYLPKFRAILPEKKVVRFYQIENKIEAVYDVGLAANIPLVN